MITEEERSKWAKHILKRNVDKIYETAKLRSEELKKGAKMNIETNDAGYMINPDEWSEEVMYYLAEKDGMKLTEDHVKYILAAREMYAKSNTVPSIRAFAKSFGMDRKAKPLYELFESGVMKRISKWGGMPQPTGCV